VVAGSIPAGRTGTEEHRKSRKDTTGYKIRAYERPRVTPGVFVCPSVSPQDTRKHPADCNPIATRMQPWFTRYNLNRGVSACARVPKGDDYGLFRPDRALYCPRTIPGVQEASLKRPACARSTTYSQPVPLATGKGPPGAEAMHADSSIADSGNRPTTPPLSVIPTIGPAEVASVLGVHVRSVTRMVREGRIPGAFTHAHRVRIRLHEFNEWVAAGCPEVPLPAPKGDRRRKTARP
jgi:excisionase family DNA binding protein